MFRDENARVERKVTVKHEEISMAVPPELSQQIPRTQSPFNQDAGSFSELAVNAVTQYKWVYALEPREFPPIKLSTSLKLAGWDPEDKGIQFFFTHYIPLDSPEMIALFKVENNALTSSAGMFKVDETFRNVVSAVGLAGLSNVNNDQELMVVARQKYGASMRRIGESLRMPSPSTHANTLKSIMMLAMFEVSPEGSISYGADPL
jgi:hypothetical protein